MRPRVDVAAPGTFAWSVDSAEPLLTSTPAVGEFGRDGIPVSLGPPLPPPVPPPVEGGGGGEMVKVAAVDPAEYRVVMTLVAVTWHWPVAAYVNDPVPAFTLQPAPVSEVTA